MDDVGFSDIGNPNSIPTPEIDSLLKKEAIKLNWHYAHPTCTPSRAALLSGRYAANVALPFAMMLGSPVGLPLDVPTLPQILKEHAGYSTHMVGKWHLGNARFSQLPISRGFQSWTGSFHWGLDAWTKEVHLTPHVSLGIDWMHATDDRNYSHFAEPRHATDAVTDEALKLIDAHAGKQGTVENGDAGSEESPLFLYLSYHAGHGPLLPHPRHTAACQHHSNAWRRDYCGLVVGLDEAVGTVTRHARGVLGDDLVVVVGSDNGASTWEGGLNVPLRSGKFSPFEGGVRVPCLAVDYSRDGRYFGPGGRNFDGLAHLADWMPTLLTLAGVSMRELEIETDGFDLSPALRSVDQVFNSTNGPRTSVLTELFREGECMMGPHVHGVALRKGDFKFMEGIFQDLNYYRESHDSHLNTTDTSLYAKATEFIITHTEWMFGKGPFDTIRGVISIAFLQGHYIKEQGSGDTYLFDLSKDPTESHNLASLMPSVVAEFREEVDAIKSQLRPQQPYWLVIPEEAYLASRVAGDCSANPNIPPEDCWFHHPYIADDVEDSELTLIDDTVPLVERIILELMIIPVAKVALPLLAVIYFAKRASHS